MYSDESVFPQLFPVNLCRASLSLFYRPHDTWQPSIGSIIIIIFKSNREKIIKKNYKFELQEEIH